MIIFIYLRQLCMGTPHSLDFPPTSQTISFYSSTLVQNSLIKFQSVSNFQSSDMNILLLAKEIPSVDDLILRAASNIIKKCMTPMYIFSIQTFPWNHIHVFSSFYLTALCEHITGILHISCSKQNCQPIPSSLPKNVFLQFSSK